MDAAEQDRLVRAWVKGIADRDHGGDMGAALKAIATAAWRREQEPGNPWAELASRIDGSQAARAQQRAT